MNILQEYISVYTRSFFRVVNSLVPRSMQSGPEHAVAAVSVKEGGGGWYQPECAGGSEESGGVGKEIMGREPCFPAFLLQIFLGIRVL